MSTYLSYPAEDQPNLLRSGDIVTEGRRVVVDADKSLLLEIFHIEYFSVSFAAGTKFIFTVKRDGGLARPRMYIDGPFVVTPLSGRCDILFSTPGSDVYVTWVTTDGNEVGRMDHFPQFVQWEHVALYPVSNIHLNFMFGLEPLRRRLRRFLTWHRNT